MSANYSQSLKSGTRLSRNWPLSQSIKQQKRNTSLRRKGENNFSVSWPSTNKASVSSSMVERFFRSVPVMCSTETFIPLSVNQVYGYCLAFKDMVPENRRIVASLRERGTENIYWASYFDEKAEKDIIKLINRMHKLLVGETEFKATDNPNKCSGCRFNHLCDKKTNF